MTTPQEIDYTDVQGTILRGYGAALARHFILTINKQNRSAAHAFIASLVNGTDGVPQITTAAPWTIKPEYFVNISFTAVGLLELGVTWGQLGTFDSSFTKGATNSGVAGTVGDIDDSAPEKWIGGLNDGLQVHVVLSLWVDQDPAVLEKVTGQLRAAFAAGMTELSAHDAQALPDNRVHFNYRDGIAQPTVQGAPPRKSPEPDDQPSVPTGEFLLGYANATSDTYTVQPEQLSLNSSYAAFRILEQDVAGFEQFLQEYAQKANISPEMLAAKVCGRWRNGNPLMLAPTDPGDPLPDDQLNDFTYVNKDLTKDDTLGLVCPIGSHIRRNNPRNAGVAGAGPLYHRIVRRAMPYGPAYDPQNPDETPRGLIGYFINGSFKYQFEFLQSQWDQTCLFVSSATDPNGLKGNAVHDISGEDIFLGRNKPADSSFTLSSKGAQEVINTTLKGWSRMVTTKGGAYVFLPSIKGLRYLATLT